MKNSPNGAGPPDSLSVPQDAKSNPSNGLVERVARIVDPEVFAPNGQLAFTLNRPVREAALSKAREILALYQQEGVLSRQRGENRSANASRRPTLHGADTEAVGSGAWVPRDGTRQSNPAGFVRMVQENPGFWAWDFPLKYLKLTIDTRAPTAFWLADRDGNAILGTRVIEAILRQRGGRRASPATPIGGLSLGVEGDQGASRAMKGGTAQAPKSDSTEGH